ncbi:hypothetical protein RUM44_005028 [Polyplax serrata]|uniref:Uncharacterized protein n=1 Tax=Polyplax serrata TaxID=468196 RepID=A0ABR1AYI5_POLSC
MRAGACQVHSGDDNAVGTGARCDVFPVCQGRWKGNPAGDTQKNYLLSSGGVEIENIRRPNKGRTVPGTTASVVKARMPEITEKCIHPPCFPPGLGDFPPTTGVRVVLTAVSTRQKLVSNILKRSKKFQTFPLTFPTIGICDLHLTLGTGLLGIGNLYKYLIIFEHFLCGEFSKYSGLLVWEMVCGTLRKQYKSSAFVNKRKLGRDTKGYKEYRSLKIDTSGDRRLAYEK